MNSGISTFLLILLFFSSSLKAQYFTAETDNLQLIYYDRGHAYLVPHLIRSYENALQYHKNLFDYELTERVTMILEELGDYGNAGATSVPHNLVLIGISPVPFDFETTPIGERLTSSMNHELVHIVALDMPSRSDKVYRTLFSGKVRPDNDDPISILYGYLTTPRLYSPRWYHEGIAVFLSQFRNVYGKPLDDVWSEWIEWERQWQSGNLERIRRNPVTTDRPISRRALGAISRAFYDEERREIYAAISYPGQVAHIAGINIEDGSIRRIVDVEGAAMYFVSSLAYDGDTGTIFYTTNNNGWRHLNSVNVDTGESTRLKRSSSPHDVRTGDLTFNPIDRSLWGVRHSGGYSSIVRLPYPYKQWNRIHTMDFTEVVFDIDISPDGKYLSAAVTDIGGNSKLILMETENLLNEIFTYRTLFGMEGNTPANFTFTSDTRYLYGSTYYSGVSNIVRYDLPEDTLEWITNAETGYFRPIPISPDSIIAFRYTGEGFIPVMLANEHHEQISSIGLLGFEVVTNNLIVQNWQLKPDRFDVDEVIRNRGDYTPMSNTSLASIYPIVRGYRNHVNAGLKFKFNDPTLLHQIDLSLTYTPTSRIEIDERFHATVNYKFRRWNIFANYNADDFYDLFGPTKTSRKGYSFGLNYQGSIIYDTPRIMDYNLNASYYGGMEQLPDFQNIDVRVPDFFMATARLNYQYFLHSLGAVDHEKGHRRQGISYFNYADGTLYPRVLTNLDYGIAHYLFATHRYGSDRLPAIHSATEMNRCRIFISADLVITGWITGQPVDIVNFIVSRASS